MTSPTDKLDTVVCPACGSAVPAGKFCGRCGAELAAAPTLWRALLRPTAFAAAPQEKLALPAVTSSLFPHLERPSRSPFRIGLLLLFAALIGFSWLRLVGPLITVAGLGVPVLFVLYLWQTSVYRDMPRHGLAVSAMIGTGLGVGWTLFTGGVVARAYGIPMAAGFALEQVLSVGLAVSLVGAFLMTVPAFVVRLLRPPVRESLDGFVIGALGALTFTGASTITNFAPQFVSGLINNVQPMRLAVHAALYGVAAPLTAGASGGVIGLMLWFRPGSQARAHRGRWRAALVFFTLLVGSLYAALWVMEAARLPQMTQLLLHLALALVAVLALRVAIQMALLREAHDPMTGQPVLCVHCDRVVPDMPFCPACGAASRASSRISRRLRRQSPPVRTGADADGSV
ncbi:MAG: zinc ribbon domain-containing protein [Mycobacterium sp.]|jgi:RNA polymerase subunit RPABC4/transcription elongation factor Spt4